MSTFCGMVRQMKPKVDSSTRRRIGVKSGLALLVLACWALVAIPAAISCAASSTPGVCNTLNNCCNNTDDMSSCSETALSQTDAAACSSLLATYVAQGVCLEDGGTPTAPGGSGSH